MGVCVMDPTSGSPFGVYTVNQQGYGQQMNGGMVMNGSMTMNGGDMINGSGHSGGGLLQNVNIGFTVEDCEDEEF